jgi:hypothetical protein
MAFMLLNLKKYYLAVLEDLFIKQINCRGGIYFYSFYSNEKIISSGSCSFSDNDLWSNLFGQN